MLKNVEKCSDGTSTSAVVESIGQPISIDASMLAIFQVK